MSLHPLQQLALDHHAGKRRGVTSVCSAHPVVIEAALCLSMASGQMALIEATCNQVNQDGGYTGMTPADFRDFVHAIADRIGLPRAQILLGGDHLGPNPWKHLPAAQAMAKAEVMIAEYAAAGFTKLHLDCSMGCLNEPEALGDAEAARRAAALAVVAEGTAQGDHPPVYVIGTEVPVPGGAAHALDHLALTTPEAALTTYEVHRAAFAAVGAEAAFSRVIALVVQPGVEFGHSDVIHYHRGRAEALSGTLAQLPGLIFEAHSTDYQTEQGLRALVEDGFAILKVGPWLTYVLREALYGLDALADVLDGSVPQHRLMAAMEAVMRAAPGNWQKYYAGSEADLFQQRHFSYSDRIRYHWPDPRAQEAVAALASRLEGKALPAPLVSQYLPVAAESADAAQIKAVSDVLRLYQRACSGDGSLSPGP